MANEKRLIDANALLYEYCQSNGCNEVIDEVCPNCFTAGLIANAPTVDAVPIEQHIELQKQYIELREQYDKIFTEFHELRDDFVDYVCSGIPNPSPFCKNRCAECVDAWGWCKQTDKCKGFNPAEVFLDEERRTDA